MTGVQTCALPISGTLRKIWSAKLTGPAVAGPAATAALVIIPDKNKDATRALFRCLHPAHGRATCPPDYPPAGHLDYSNSPPPPPVVPSGLGSPPRAPPDPPSVPPAASPRTPGPRGMGATAASAARTRTISPDPDSSAGAPVPYAVEGIDGRTVGAHSMPAGGQHGLGMQYLRGRLIRVAPPLNEKFANQSSLYHWHSGQFWRELALQLLVAIAGPLGIGAAVLLCKPDRKSVV